ncbi:unnamed protein product [Blepharisma stoltei]|uniref:Uncharacterized protein n=1 Tax=Blepharisma stoltei TaxID=1481888 RepID=A0AAU9J327_9CILI|nr:unnamed protein product [Blepharisma stoltei]
MSLQGNGDPVYIKRYYNAMKLHQATFKDQILIFSLSYGQKEEVPISEGKWIFLVYYFVKIQSIWVWTVISPEFSTVTLFDDYEPGNTIIIGNYIDADYYEIQFFKKATINSSIVTLYDISDATYDATTSTCPASCASYCHPEMGCWAQQLARVRQFAHALQMMECAHLATIQMVTLQISVNAKLIMLSKDLLVS